MALQKSLPKKGDGNRKECGKKCSNILKGISQPLFVLTLVCLYSLGGGALFHLLENKTAQKMCTDQKIEDRGVKVKYVGKLITIFQEADGNSLVSNLTDLLEEYRKRTLEIGDFGDCITTGWEMMPSTFFAVTIMSTIGYGNVALQTDAGKIVAICYAIVGIPIFGLFLATIGAPLTEGFQWTYEKIYGCVKNLCKKRKKKANLDSYLGSGGIDNYGLVREEDLYKRKNINDVNMSSNSQDAKNWYSNGRKTPNFDANISVTLVTYRGQVGGEADDGKTKSHPVPAKRPKKPEELGEEDEDEEPVMIPLMLTMGILIVYLLFGVAIFTQFEGWNMLESIYYSFITLSTIGFGDYVPGADNPTLCIIAAVYVLFGMALLAMCFNFAEQKVRARISWIQDQYRRKTKLRKLG